MKALLTYYGGKQKLVPQILPLIPKHHLYCEPFAGGAAILFAKEPSKIEVLNDTNGELINFYKMAKEKFPKLKKEIESSLHSRSLHYKARFIYNQPQLFTEIERAWAIFIMAHQSYSSILDSTWSCGVKDATSEKKFQSKKCAFTREYAKSDRDHVHVHICSSGIEYLSGKSMRLSRRELYDLKKNAQRFQVEKFPELSHSVVNHGRKNKTVVTDREVQYKKRTGKQTKKEELLSILHDCQKHSKNQEDFFARLKGCKLQTYVRGGRIYGVVYGNRKYRFKRLGISFEKFRGIGIEKSKELQEMRKQNKHEYKYGRER